MQHVDSLNSWFVEKLSGVDCSDDVKAYIVNVLSTFKTCDVISHKSIVLMYNDAKLLRNFELYQQIGDWVLWSGIICPDVLKENRDVVMTIASLSYYSCNRILSYKWPLYDELAANMPEIIFDVKNKLK